MNLMMLLEMAANGFGDRVAVGSRHGDGLTYQDLYQHAGRAAATIREGSPSTVTMVDEASPALPVSLFACAWAGVPFVPLNYRLDDHGLHALLDRSAPTLSLVGDDHHHRVSRVDGVSAISRDDFLSRVADTDGAVPEADWGFDGDDIAILLFTSGTTGEPKAAVLRHKHLVSYIFGSVEFMGAGDEEATLMSVPPYHIAGMAAILSSVYAGRRIVQLPHFDADEWIDLARTEAVTHAMVVPTMLSRIVDRLDATGGDPIPTLRAISYGGGKMPRPVIERALELFPEAGFVNAYGLTETSSTVALLGPEDHRLAASSDDPVVRNRLSSVGRPLPGIEISIRTDEGAEAPAGHPGEIFLRGEQVSGEYLGKGSRLTADGWFPTNDGGWLDDEGFLFLSGRIDDIIIRGAENISPGEIEDVLLTHRAVADACSIGVPDRQWGEKVVAAVVLHDEASTSVEELQDLVRQQLRSSRTPEHIEFVDELPYNETGKLLRRVVRSLLAHLGDEI